MTQTALVLFSGGQDSTVCLAWALDRFDRVETVGFDYGQRHRVELACRNDVLAALREAFPDWAPRLGEDHDPRPCSSRRKSARLPSPRTEPSPSRRAGFRTHSFQGAICSSLPLPPPSPIGAV